MTTASPASCAIRPAVRVRDAELEPQAPRADRDRLARVLDAQVRPAEHVDDVDRPGRRDRIRQRRVARLPVDPRPRVGLTATTS